MAIPSLEDVMHPLLQFAAKKNRVPIQEVVSYLGQLFRLSAEEKTRRYPNGSKIIFYHMVNFAATYLKKAGHALSISRFLFLTLKK